MIFLFFNDLFKNFYEYISLIHLFESIDNIEMIKSYINDSNRMALYVLGTTVSANIYLYNSKTKISSSSMWDSKQITLLFFNLLVNLIILLTGLYLTHGDLIFSLQSTVVNTRMLLIVHLFLLCLSSILFLITLWSFIQSFWQTRNMKILYRQVNKLLYPKKLFKIYSNCGYINDHSKLKFQKHLGLIKLRFNKIDKCFQKLQNRPLIAKVTSFIFLSTIFLYRTWYYVYLLFIKNHKLIEVSSSLSSKKAEKIRLKIEILCQNLEHVINSNSDRGMQKYCEEWNSLFSKIAIMLFHIECKAEDKNDILILYRHLLHTHSKLISVTSESYEQRKFHKQFIITFFSGLAYKEEYISSVYFDKRSRRLEEIYFDELLELFINLIKDGNGEIFNLLQNGEININSLLASKHDLAMYFGSESRNRKRKYEELFTSILLKMVELNINEYLSSTMGIILSLRDQGINPSNESKRPLVSLSTNKKNKINEDIVTTREVRLTFKSKISLVYAIVKANEVENLKAAGYITKVISSNVDFKSLINPIKNIQMVTERKNNINYDSGIYKINFNDYSFHYCLDKTLLLLSAQYFLKQDSSQDKDFLSIFTDINHDYFLEKFKLKTKEYNMIALAEKNLEKLQKFLYSSNQV